MPSKNNITALKQKPKSTLKTVETVKSASKPVARKRAGRKAKPVGEKESFTLPLKLTEAEGALLKEKAGMVPLATFVKAYIREQTSLLK